MTLQTSGAISLADIAAEYGGTAPHSISEYYLGAGAPSTVVEQVTASSLGGSVSDVRGNYWGTPATLNSGNYLYVHNRWADNGGTGSGNTNWVVNKTGTYHYVTSYYIQNATNRAQYTWNIKTGDTGSYSQYTQYYTAYTVNAGVSVSGTIPLTAGDRVQCVVSWPSAGWASSGVYFYGNSGSTSIDVAANTSLPSSGTIRLNQFYGGRAS